MKSEMIKNPVLTPWQCQECDTENEPDDKICICCNEPKPEEGEVSPEVFEKIETEWRDEFLKYLCEEDM